MSLLNDEEENPGLENTSVHIQKTKRPKERRGIGRIANTECHDGEYN